VPARRTNALARRLHRATIARYEKEEMPERYSTRATYQSYINNQIRPRWAQTPMNAVKPMAVEDWLRSLDLAPTTKSHVRGLMHTIFQCAERWELNRQESDQAGSRPRRDEASKDPSFSYA
jgi:hypothetical protein